MKKKLPILLCLFLSTFNFGQDLFIPFDKHPEYTKSFYDNFQLIESNKINDYILAFNHLTTIEKKLIKEKDSNNLSIYYLNKALIFFLRNDFNNTAININKSLKYNNFKNDFITGKNYELKSISYGIIHDQKQTEKYVYLSKKYLEKSGDNSTLNDLYYNLTYVEFFNQNWNKVVEFGVKSDSINRLTLKNNPDAEINLLLAVAYFYRNDFNKYNQYIKITENTDEFKKNELNSLPTYYKIKSKNEFRLGNKDLAYQYLETSAKIREDFTNNKLISQSKGLGLESQMKQARFELSESKNDNLIQKNILIYLATFALILIILAFFQFRHARFKSKTNLLLEEKNEELNVALIVKNKLLDSIAHELRTPLNSLKGVSFLLKDKQEKLNEQNYEIIENSTEQLISLVSNIIDYNVMDSNEKIQLSPKLIDIDNLIYDIVNYHKKIRNNNNDFDINVSDTIYDNLEIDNARLKQLLSCIIDNSNKFTTNGKINISVKPIFETENQQTLQFTIKDTGIGIKKDKIESIFDLFTQASNQIYLKYGGSGLGLSLVKKNLELLNGQFNIDSDIDKGTTFELQIPFEKINLNNKKATLSDHLQKCGKNLILIVEDNKINQMITQKMLISKGYTCEIAENGKIAVDMISKKNYCLILMDIMMPVMDGFEASKIIKTIKPNIPIAALTAISEELNKDKFNEVQILKILNKPVNIKELSETASMYCN